MSDSKENIKNKIIALLAKSKENGATEAEAANALQKAQELMAKYMISQSELEIKGTKCVKLTVAIYPSSYNLYFIHSSIAELFDCVCWLTGKRKAKKAIYFGFEEDTQLASYFYTYLCQMIESEAKRYKKSEQYKRLTKSLHGRTVVASFIRGLQMRLIERIKEQVVQKRKTVVATSGRDLVIFKKNTVQDEFEDLGFTIKRKTCSAKSIAEAAFNEGVKRGDEVGLSQGITATNDTNKGCSNVA